MEKLFSAWSVPRGYKRDEVWSLVKYTRLKLGAGQSYDHLSDEAAVVA
jgi:hypothetical protein